MGHASQEPKVTELFSQLFVKLPPVTDCENLNHPLLSFDLVDDAKSSHLVFPQPIFLFVLLRQVALGEVLKVLVGERVELELETARGILRTWRPGFVQLFDISLILRFILSTKRVNSRRSLDNGRIGILGHDYVEQHL